VSHARLHLETAFYQNDTWPKLVNLQKICLLLLPDIGRSRQIYMEYLTLPVVLKLTWAAWKPSEQISAPSLCNQYSVTSRLLRLLPLLLLPSLPHWSAFLLGCGGGKWASKSPQTTDMEPNNSMSATGRIIHWYSLLGVKRPLYYEKGPGRLWSKGLCFGRPTVRRLLPWRVTCTCSNFGTVHSVHGHCHAAVSLSNMVSAA